MEVESRHCNDRGWIPCSRCLCALGCIRTFWRSITATASFQDPRVLGDGDHGHGGLMRVLFDECDLATADCISVWWIGGSPRMAGLRSRSSNAMWTSLWSRAVPVHQAVEVDIDLRHSVAAVFLGCHDKYRTRRRVQGCRTDVRGMLQRRDNRSLLAIPW